MSAVVQGILVAGLLLAGEGRILLNGVAIDGVRNQEFTNATVRIDAQGRVLISAPDYEVAPPADHVHLKPNRLAPGEGALIIFQRQAHGKTGIVTEVLVNGKKVADELDPMQAVHDLITHLRP